MFTQQKKEIEKNLLDIMVASLRDGTLDADECRESARHIIEGWGKVTTPEEAHTFITDLSTRWPAYEQVLPLVGKYSSEKKDADDLKKVQDKLKNYLT